jgi:hypothetical protein
MVFCSESFSEEEQILLSNKLNSTIGCRSSLTKTRKGTGYRIFVPQSSVPIVLEFIGNCPFPSMGYKWCVVPVKRIHERHVSPDLLRTMYVRDHMTIAGIGAVLGLPIGTISGKIHRHGLSRKKRPIGSGTARGCHTDPASANQHGTHPGMGDATRGSR